MTMPTLETVRTIIKQRDGVDDDAVDALFEYLAETLQEGVAPDDALAEVFGLEPDYLFDTEVWACIEENRA